MKEAAKKKKRDMAPKKQFDFDDDALFESDSGGEGDGVAKRVRRVPEAPALRVDAVEWVQELQEVSTATVDPDPYQVLLIPSFFFSANKLECSSSFCAFVLSPCFSCEKEIRFLIALV